MITGADVKSGYGQKKEKPYNSILPYLRAKEAEKAEARKKPASPKSIKKPVKIEEPDYIQNEYDMARLEILAEE